MDYRVRIVATFFLLIIISSLSELKAQEEAKYRFTPAPDIWYNDVDGIRLGIRVLGEMEDSFKDGPHRLDAGFWVHTWLPKTPVSYYISFIEPIPSITSYGNEGSIQLISSYRTGFTQQKIGFNKRWQFGFEELRYSELRASISQEKLTDIEYRPFPQLWQTEWKSLIELGFINSSINGLGQLFINSELIQNVNSNSSAFTVFKVEVFQKIKLGSSSALRFRGFVGHATENTAAEHLFGLSFRQPNGWLNNGVSRAKGTIPSNWLESGLIQFAGGGNLRGYLEQDAKLLKAGLSPTYNTAWAINTELEFPNPINSVIKNISIIGELVEFRTYGFFDFGKGTKKLPSGTIDPLKDVLALFDAGIGSQFSINIPDYLGKDRGIFIRYDVPFWISKPDTNSRNFSYRQVIGIGAIFSF